MNRMLLLGATLGVVSLSICPLVELNASEVATISLVFETECLDLDTGAVSAEASPGMVDGADFRIAYNALRSPAGVIVPNGFSGVEVAFVSDVSFDGVTTDTVGDLAFSSQAADLPLGPTDTVVVLTDTGAMFKLGNAIETESGVTFNYAAL